MSRIGKMPVVIPAGVTVTIADGNVVTVKGKLGTLENTFSSKVTIEEKDGHVLLSVKNPEDGALHGLTRALLHNMVTGVTAGYSKTLDIVGVGYRAEKSGKNLNLALGFSHPVIFEEKDGITFEVPSQTQIIVKGIDKQAVGQMAAEIRAVRPPEPYLGNGVKYTDEKIRRKAGKTGK